MADNQSSPPKAGAFEVSVSELDPEFIPEIRAIYASSQGILDDIYANILNDTGFDFPRVIGWTPKGEDSLPNLPPPDNEITKVPHITAMTEAVAVVDARKVHSNVIVPYARVEHQEWPTVQHHGIDFIGYEKFGDKVRLWIFEVMASVEEKSPPGTVYDHRKQLTETTHPRPWRRLRTDLQTLLRELSLGPDRDALRQVLISLEETDLTSIDVTVCRPTLVHEQGKRGDKDWDPFINKAGDFGKNHLPSRLVCRTVELDCGYHEFLEHLHESDEEE